jgi:predicted O-methyltransferase YrrM
MSYAEYIHPGGMLYNECMRRKTPDRSHTFLAALTLFDAFRGLTIVEVGTTRHPQHGQSDGHSTLLFAQALSYRGDGDLWTLDTMQSHLDVAWSLLPEKHRQYVTCVHADAVEWFESLEQEFPSIDLLYLDGLGFSDESGVEYAQAEMYEQIIAAEALLNTNAIILLDDNCVGEPTINKTAMAKEYLRQKGYTLVLDAYQSLWVQL